MISKPRIAIQGIKASFHEEAALKFFGKEITILPCASFKHTFDALKEGVADFAVMAIENSIAGSLLPNYNLLRDYNYGIVGEVYLNIRLHFLVWPDVDFCRIKFVISHPIALSQCNDFFRDNPQLQIIEGKDTATCAKKIQEEKLTDTATVANILAAEVYALKPLFSSIETHKKNYTRFLIIRKERGITDAHKNKASISFQTENKVGSLAGLLNIFAENEVNLTKIQSMPVLGKRNEYIFYLDLEWKDSKKYERAIGQVLKHTVNFNVMGEYLKNDKV